MKRVFSRQEEVAEAFARQTQDYGTCPGHRIWFEGHVLYSYGRHFPIAKYWPTADVFTIVSRDEAPSVSTRQHIAKAWSALFFDISYPKSRILWSCGGLTLGEAIRYSLARENAKLESAKRRKKCHLAETDRIVAYEWNRNALNALMAHRQHVPNADIQNGKLVYVLDHEPTA